METLYLLPVPSQPRFHKRIVGLATAGIRGRALYFDRDYIPGSELPVPSCSLGHIRHGHYVARIASLLRAVPAVRAEIRGVGVVYAFGVDMTLLALMARGVRRGAAIVYESGDVFQFTHETVLSRVARRIERWVVGHVDLLVTVTPGLASDYYVRIQGADPAKILIVENKVRRGTSENTVRARRPQADPLVIGRFGVIRDQRSWDILKTLVRAGSGRVRVKVRGVFLGIPDYQRDLDENPELVYEGPYRNPEDLQDVYDGIDLTWVADSSEGGVEARWAGCNRFYEACAFARPMIVYAHQAEGVAAAHYDVGLLIDMDEPEAAASRILAISDDDLSRWHVNMLAVPKSRYELSDEHDVLAARLSSLGV